MDPENLCCLFLVRESVGEFDPLYIVDSSMRNDTTRWHSLNGGAASNRRRASDAEATAEETPGTAKRQCQASFQWVH
jgi:hypothetical protein